MKYLKELKIDIKKFFLTSNKLIKDFEKEFWTMTKLNKCQI